jgi:hypothetical protein
MSDRFASVLVCDELLFALNGKWTISGIYTGDLAIPTENTVIPQMVFLFLIETDIDDPFQSLKLEVTFPGMAPAYLELPENALVLQGIVPPGRTKRVARVPFLITQPVLRSGKIVTKVIHEKGEISATGPWITVTPPSTISPPTAIS